MLLVRVLRIADISLVSGLIAAFVVAVGAPMAMSVVAAVDASAAAAADVEPGFTGETVSALPAVTIPGVKGGLLYVMIRRWLPGSTVVRGLTFGVVLLLFPGMPMMLIERDLDIGPAFLTLPLFGALFVGYGLMVAALVRRFESLWPASRPRPVLATLAFTPLGLLALMSLVLVIPLPTH